MEGHSPAKTPALIDVTENSDPEYGEDTEYDEQTESAEPERPFIMRVHDMERQIEQYRAMIDASEHHIERLEATIEEKDNLIRHQGADLIRKDRQIGDLIGTAADLTRLLTEASRA